MLILDFPKPNSIILLLVLRSILQEHGDFTWEVSDCEELVGVTWSSSDSVKN